MDIYPGGLAVLDPYASYQTWYVDAVNGADVGSPGNVKPAGWTYQSYDNALLDVFYAAALGPRRIVVKPTATYRTGVLGGTSRGSYFPFGGSAQYPYVIQGDPSTTTLPVIKGGWTTTCAIHSITNATNAVVTFNNPGNGPAVNPFRVGDFVEITNVTGMAINDLLVPDNVVTAIGGSSGAWTVTLSTNSTALGSATNDTGYIYFNCPAFSAGNQGGYGTTGNSVSNVVIRKFEFTEGVADCLYCYDGPGAGGATSNLVIEYCYAHDWYYPPNNPSGTCLIGCPSNESAQNLTVRFCKLDKFGLHVVDSGVFNTYAAQPGSSVNYSGNCVPFETYGSDNCVFQNNKFTNCWFAIWQKLANQFPNHCNNWLIDKNIFATSYQSIGLSGASGASADGSSGTVISNNLFYGKHPTYGTGYAMLFQGSGHVGFQGSGMTLNNNTFAEDLSGAWFWMCTANCTWKDNVVLGPFFRISLDPVDTNSDSAITFTQLDYNCYDSTTAPFQITWNGTSFFNLHDYTTFAQWKTAFSVPRDHTGAATGPAPPELSADPDAHGTYIPNLSASFNTGLKCFPNRAAHDYTITTSPAGCPLLTGSSTGGRLGYDPTNIGPGW